MILVILIPLAGLFWLGLILLTLAIGPNKAANLRNKVSVTISQSPVKYFLVFNGTETELTKAEARKMEKDGYEVIQR